MQKSGSNLCKYGLMLVLLVAFLLRMQPVMNAPILQNEGILLTIAAELNSGKLLYRDLFWEQMPALPVALAPLFNVFSGHVLWVSRVVSVFISMLSICMVFRLATELAAGSQLVLARYRPVAGLIAAALLAFSPVAIVWSRHSNPEQVGLLFSLASIYYVVYGERNRHWLLWATAGLFTGLAVLFSYAAILPILALGLFGAYQLVRYRDWYLLRGMLAFGTGAALTLIPVFIVIGASHVTGDFLQLFSTLNLRMDPAQRLTTNLEAAAEWLILWPVIIPGIAMLFRKQNERNALRFILFVWLGLEVGFLFLHKNIDFGLADFSVLLLPITVLLPILAGGGCALLFSQSSKRGQKMRWVPLTLLVLIGLALPMEHLAQQVEAVSLVQPNRLEEQQIGAILNSLSTPTEPILVLGNAGFHIESDRSVTGRFFHLPDNLGTSLLRYTADSELVAAVSHQRPELLLISDSYKDRISPIVHEKIAESWAPMMRFDYAYQGGATLYLPQDYVSPIANRVEVNQKFENEIELIEYAIVILTPHAILVETHWESLEKADESYWVDIDLLNKNQQVVGQTAFHPRISSHPNGDTVSNVQIIAVEHHEQVHELHLQLMGEKMGKQIELLDGMGRFLSFPVTP